MYIAILVFSMLAAGCGTDEGYDEDQVSFRIKQESTPAPEPVVTAPAPVEPEEPVVVAADRELTPDPGRGGSRGWSGSGGGDRGHLGVVLGGRCGHRGRGAGAFGASVGDQGLREPPRQERPG